MDSAEGVDGEDRGGDGEGDELANTLPIECVARSVFQTSNSSWSPMS